jgi:L-gulonolactone oxidase
VPLSSTPHGYLFENWAKTERALPAEASWPAREREVVAAVRRARASGRRLKVVGAGHSWSDAALPQHHGMSLDRLAGPVSIDRRSGEVTVWAGTRLHALNTLLAGHGLAMPVLGSVDQQSVAGAISTGTHGSAPRLGNLASLVARLRMVLPDGEVAEVDGDRAPDLFQAARVGLGALGVITQVTFRCVPAFDLEEESYPLGFEEALRALPGLLDREEFVKLWWLPHTDRVQVSCYRRTRGGSTFRPALRWLDERVLNGLVFAAVLGAGDADPARIPALNRAVGALYFRPARRVARSDRSFHIAMPPLHDETEAAIPVEHTAAALRWLRGFIEEEGLAINFVVEVRFGAGDDAWLSPSYGRSTCFLGAYTAARRDRDRFFHGFEGRMLELGGRPHWGKSFRSSGSSLRPLYPRFDDFKALRGRLDPDGMLLNPFLERLFLGG